MNILVSFNDNYAMPTRVMLKSLIENNRGEIHIYVLFISLSEKTINELSSLNSSKSSIHFIQIDDSIVANAPVGEYYSKEAYIRLFAHLYLPEEIDRILWLDSDVIVNGEIGEFYHQSFDGKLYVAYKDPGCGDDAEKKASLGMPEDVPYINSGVLLMDLEEIRKRVNTENITEYIREYYDKIQYVDQDVFNGLLYDSIKAIESEDYTYNFFVNAIKPWNKNVVYHNVRIIHYTGGCKPWANGFIYYGFHLWWKYALKADGRYRKLHRSLYPSYILMTSKYRALLELQKQAPKLYDALRTVKRKIWRKDSQ